jgi:hypothetical protein
MAIPLNLTPAELATVNTIAHNLTGPVRSVPDVTVWSTRPGSDGASPVR